MSWKLIFDTPVFCLLVVVNDRFVGSFFLLLLMTSSLSLCWVFVELNADLEDFFFTSPAALYFECWLDTELANTDKERSVVAKGGAIIVIKFNSKLVQSKE
jgi:hypothetical protein